MEQLKKWKSRRNILTRALAMALTAAAVLLLPGVTSNAAQAAKIEMKETTASVKLSEVINIEVSYQVPEGTAAQLAALSADETLVTAAVTDAGNGKAVLSIAGLQPGTTVVAVYEASDPTVADHITVKCGMAEEGKVYTLTEGSSFTTVYEDRLISYNSLMNAKSGKQLAVSHLEVERNSGIDGLKVEGKLWQQEGEAAGLEAFYAVFYDASGKQIDRQPFYARSINTKDTIELIWYIPEGCTRIVLE